MARKEPELAAGSAPRYELRVRSRGVRTYQLWQVASPATPHVTSPVRIGGLKGRNLDLVEHRILRRLLEAGIRLDLGPDTKACSVPVTEHVALMLGLLFRSLAPMRSRANMISVVEGIEEMGCEEAAYWLGMAMHRRNPRRVLMALRCLLSKSRK